MDYTNYIANTVADFDAFIEYCLKPKTTLSARRQELGKNDCYHLNKQLHYNKLSNVKKVIVDEPIYVQHFYPAIDLMFNLAMGNCLLQRGNNAKKKVVLKATNNLVQYQALNLHGKYVFLLQLYWNRYDYDDNNWLCSYAPKEMHEFLTIKEMHDF